MRIGGHILAAIALVAVTVISGAASASSTKSNRQAMIPPSTSMPALKAANAPLGWTEFCARYEGECEVSTLQPVDVTLDGKTMRLLTRINDEVNAEIEPITDQEHWGVAERWDYPDDGKGDCEDFVLEKRKRLMKAGLPRQALLISVVRDRKGDGHAVLLVKTDRGDYVLDNQEPAILSWSETGYGFVKRQAQDNPNHWVSLGEPRTSVVTVGNPR
ncbi:transglutaminase-like cysteine peptidase [Terrarubrum flagellatum]|uniref:transglutaminase-like cysteine peptidase n=1 Tax=Terrirubrum flagellatum TaxID=2895980 RepID=UPI003144EDD4